MREVVIDTETTGLEVSDGHRIMEIGCVELVNHIPTGRTFHAYINPMRAISKESQRITGLDWKFLRNKPGFRAIVDEFLAFIDGAVLVAHNAPFDIRFINAELERIHRPPLTNQVIDTLPLARGIKKGGKHNLDALCRHFGVDNSKRDKHGALLDAEILSEIYLHLRGGRQIELALVLPETTEEVASVILDRSNVVTRGVTVEELALHRQFVETKVTNAIWLEYLSPGSAEAA